MYTLGNLLSAPIISNYQVIGWYLQAYIRLENLLGFEGGELPEGPVLSPPCTWACMLVHSSNWPRIIPMKRVLTLQEALRHIDFSMWLAEYQHAHGRLFLFEHPGQSLAWERASVS